MVDKFTPLVGVLVDGKFSLTPYAIGNNCSQVNNRGMEVEMIVARLIHQANRMRIDRIGRDCGNERPNR